MSDFVHLHNHTDYSLLDGAASIPRYVEKAKACGMKALAITDHGNMFGALTFYNACRKAEIKPIIGCEFYSAATDRKDRRPPVDGNRYYHLIMLAMNDKGYHNLMELNSYAYKEGFYYKPRIDDELIEKYSDNIICLSACLGGEILQHLLANDYQKAKERALWFKSIFPDRYYLEMQDHGLPEQKRTNPMLVRLAKECDIPLVCTNDIHYIEKDDWNAHDTLLCIGTNSKKNDQNRLRYKEGEFYFRTPEEMEERFSWCPEALENTGKIADRIDIQISFPGPVLPKCTIPPEFKDEADYLVYLANEGLKQRYETVTEELQKRLDYELGIIIQMKFPGYFLIVRDYIHWAKMHGIPVGPGRGSGAGSLVAYSITITDVDPMKYNLLFERFLNPERVSMPDFDIDFCFERRGEVIEYVTEHYGKDRVGQIVTFGTLKPKAVVKDVARVLDIPFDEANRICALIPDGPKVHLSDAFEMEPRLKQIEESGPIYKELFDTARRLEGLNRHSSLHAAGVVIGREPLDQYVPLASDPKTGSVFTQYTMTQIEDCGLVKMDFLGLKTLTLIKHTVDLIKKRVPDFDINKIDEEDKKTFDMLCRGDSKCVFQFESDGMANILKRAMPSNIEELVALNALYRPGPMQFIDQYIDSKFGKTPIKYPDPSLEGILKTTYGVIVYQEQVMQVAQIIAGYSLGQADILRRIMGKKKAYELANQLIIFKKGAVERGYTEEHAEEIFHILEPFAGYGFNKSHAVAYSVVAYQTAFLKANYPAEFLAANLTNEMSNPDKFTEYLNLAPKYGLKILPPSINRSEKHFNVSNGDIIYGLAGIKNVGESITEGIIREREKNGPYKDFMEFLSRQSESINSKTLESLIKAGAFDELGEGRATLLANLDDAIKFDRAEREASAYGQLSLFGEEEASIGSFRMREVEEWEKNEKLRMEKELLGFYISGHPLDSYDQQIAACVRANLADRDTIPMNHPTSLIAMVTSLRQVLTKKKDKMGMYTLQTKEGDVDAVAFPSTYETIRDLVEKDQVYGFIGTFKQKEGDDRISFLIDSVVSPNDLKPEAVSRLHIQLRKSGSFPIEELRPIQRIIRANEGFTPVSFTIEGVDGQELEAGPDCAVSFSMELSKALSEIDVVKKVWVS
ncbi:MAG: DNA polymerase III subunit alpha [Candidatus Ornithospirochaeta sp.]|nr:DNA polymerase III subunit alpha [Candidatus Ornithospirochaeta sp.]